MNLENIFTSLGKNKNLLILVILILISEEIYDCFVLFTIISIMFLIFIHLQYYVFNLKQ